MRQHPDTNTGFSSENYEVYVFEEILACNIKDVVGDLCLADAEIIMSYVTNQLHGNMDEIVTSSVELYFKDRTLSYARAAGVTFELGVPASIVLNMEFAHGPVSVLFELVLGSRDIGVHINKVLLIEGVPEGQFGAVEFAQILRSARRTPLPDRYTSALYPPDVIRH
ncbi:hypothetical protein [Microvirga roseola]|uniref:hypothetical protein n=1 Tax=Microvirga roseola TaxID=2883126 RepID=UPI001E338174|nr:hypothetical protein [Microvirga roseola]